MLLKSVLIAAAAISLVAPAALADDLGFGWQDSAPVNGDAGDVSHNSAKTDTNRFYQPVPNGDGDTRVNAPVHQTSNTIHGGVQDTLGGLPDTTSGATLPGGGVSPGNLAYMTEHKSRIGGTLPATKLDSFVAKSGYNDSIYGDEGTFGPPPYSSFNVINNGGLQMTTGHKGKGLPSAWY
jgi:hypothetical protein